MKKEIYQSLDNLERRLGTASKFDATIYSRAERKDLIRELIIKHLAGLDDAGRRRTIDEATLFRVSGSDYKSISERQALEQTYGRQSDNWPDAVQAAFLHTMIVDLLSHLEPDELQAIDSAAKEGKH